MPKHTLPQNPADAQPTPQPAPPLDALAYKVLADVLGGSGQVIAYRPYFAHAFGGACNALLLSQLWFWANTPTVKGRAEGWFWKSQKEITAETGLTRTETGTARRKLCALGVIEETVRSVPPTVHFRVNKAKLFRLLWAHILGNSGEFEENLRAVGIEPKDAENLQINLQKTCKLNRGKPANQFAAFRQTTETTTERTDITRETLNVGPPAPKPQDAEPQAAPETGGKERTLNVGAGVKIFSQGRAGDGSRTDGPRDVTAEALEATATKIVEELRDWGSERRHRQLLSVCDQHHLSDLPWQALDATRQRLARRREGGALERPGAYYQKVLIKLLQDRQVFVPKVEEAAQMRADLGLPGDAGREQVRAAIRASLPPEPAAGEAQGEAP